MLQFPKDYSDDVLVRLAHHSTAIEGNTLTLAETVAIILYHSFPASSRNVDLREIYEIKNHEQAFHYILSELGHDHPLTIGTIKMIHAALTDKLQHDRGQFKSLENAIAGAEFQTASVVETPLLMQQWLDKLNDRMDQAQSADDYYLAISEAHIAFERIHPFSDGNGRTGRLLINYSLLQHNLPPVVISVDDKPQYMSFLIKQDSKRLSRYIQDESRKEQERIRRFQNQESAHIKFERADDGSPLNQTEEKRNPGKEQYP